MRSLKAVEKIRLFDEILLEWHNTKNKRTFPWREGNDPYRILVAEIMLQRTKAEQVAPVFLLFTSRFPKVKTLNDASLSEIESYFSNLGLLWRAKKVKKLAKSITEHFEGKIPKERKELIQLPGVGDYVADAVLCFAYNQDVAAVDSNVCRVIGRVFGLEKKKEARRDGVYRTLAQKLLPKGKCKKFNWAIIDLASTICTPKAPNCKNCPLSNICNYYTVVFPKIQSQQTKRKTRFR